MIIDHMKNIGAYGALSPNFRSACRWLTEQDPTALAPGEYRIDGENVFANLADNELTRETPAYEAHRLYADIQLVIRGRELFRFGMEGKIPEQKPDSDFYPCGASSDMPFVLEDGWFVIFLPGEIHAPGNPPEGPCTCRKLVVKVRCPELFRQEETPAEG